MFECVIPHKRPSTVHEREKWLGRYLLPALGTRRIDQIDERSLDILTAHLRGHDLAKKTVNNILSVLHCCLMDAQRWRLIRKLPEFRWERVRGQPFRFLTESEEQALVDACTPGFWQTFVVLILHTGLRFSEAAALCWSDIMERDGLTVARICKGGAEGIPGPTKSGTHRDVPLDPLVLSMLAALPHGADRIFPKPNGALMNPGSVGGRLRRFCKRAGIKPCGWHALRHTYATRLGTTPVPPRTIQHLLGHEKLETTQRYLHFDKATLTVAAREIHRAMAAPSAAVHQVSTKPHLSLKESSSIQVRSVLSPVNQHKADPSGSAVCLVAPRGVEPLLRG
jgi:integrase